MSPQFEAWKTMMQVLGSILVAMAIARFERIMAAIESLAEFDKGVDLHPWTVWLSILVVFYVMKNAHGVLITVSSQAYWRKMSKSRGRLVCSCAMIVSILVSLAVVVHMAGLVTRGRTLFDRCLVLLSLALVPSVAFGLFDGFHVFTLRQVRRANGVRNLVVGVLDQARKGPTARRTLGQYRRAWVLEDLLSVTVVGGYLVVAWLWELSQNAMITSTLIVLTAVLLLNSAFDYWWNQEFYFPRRGAR